MARLYAFFAQVAVRRAEDLALEVVMRSVHDLQGYYVPYAWMYTYVLDVVAL
jgi:hypothetical protein